MPCSEAQLAANRSNALKSCGPRTEEGKSRSRANATKHGLTAGLADVEADLSPEFIERRARWAPEHNPVGEAGHWALDRAVGASLRIERCERALDVLIATTRERARLAWDQDRSLEAAAVAARLAKDPLVASRQLETTKAGVLLLIDAWYALGQAFDGGDWSESEASKALDLLGVPPEARSRRTPIDAPAGVGLVEFRQALVLEELDRLEAIRDEVMTPLDEAGRARSMIGDLALLSKPANLILRYERDAWRRYRESIKEVKAPSPPPPHVPPRPTLPGPPLEVRPQPSRGESAPAAPALANPLTATSFPHKAAWVASIERQFAGVPESFLMPTLPAADMARPSATERSQFEGGSIG